MNCVSVNITNFGIQWDDRFVASLIPKAMQEQMAERLAAAMNIPLSIRTAELAEIGIAPPPPPPSPPPTRFNLLECDLPAVAPPLAKQKHFDALAELQASFRAAKAATKTAVQPVLTRFDLLECDEPAEPVVVKPKMERSAAPKTATTEPATSTTAAANGRRHPRFDDKRATRSTRGTSDR